MAMPNIHFFGNSGSFAISPMGMSLYMITGLVDLEITVAFRKSSSLSIIWSRPKYVFDVGIWNGTEGTFSSSKWMALM